MLSARAVQGPRAAPRRLVTRAFQGSDSNSVRVQIKVPLKVKFGQQVAVLGSIPTLGSWAPEKAVKLEWSEGDEWSGELELPVGEEVAYKLVITTDKGDVTWAPGADRTLQLPAEPAAKVAVVDDWMGALHEVSVDLPTNGAKAPAEAEAPKVEAAKAAAAAPPAKPAPALAAPAKTEAVAAPPKAEPKPSAIAAAPSKPAAAAPAPTPPAKPTAAAPAPPAKPAAAAPAPAAPAKPAAEPAAPAKPALAPTAPAPAAAAKPKDAPAAKPTTKLELPTDEDLEDLTILQLKDQLKTKGLSTDGRKVDLIDRLKEALHATK